MEYVRLGTSEVLVGRAIKRYSKGRVARPWGEQSSLLRHGSDLAPSPAGSNCGTGHPSHRRRDPVTRRAVHAAWPLLVLTG
jgi:hypothetical protein